MTELKTNPATESLRFGNIAEANRIVEAVLQQCEDLGQSPEIWNARLIRTEILRIQGKTVDALEYLHSIESAFPPSAEDQGSIIGIQKTRGYALGMIGKYDSAMELLNRRKFWPETPGFLNNFVKFFNAEQCSLIYSTIMPPPVNSISRFSMPPISLVAGISRPVGCGVLAII